MKSLNGNPSAVSFESFNYPGKYIAIDPAQVRRAGVNDDANADDDDVYDTEGDGRGGVVVVVEEEEEEETAVAKDEDPR